jgi:hypothetical protein
MGPDAFDKVGAIQRLEKPCGRQALRICETGRQIIQRHRCTGCCNDRRFVRDAVNRRQYPALGITIFVHRFNDQIRCPDDSNGVAHAKSRKDIIAMLGGTRAFRHIRFQRGADFFAGRQDILSGRINKTDPVSLHERQPGKSGPDVTGADYGNILERLPIHDHFQVMIVAVVGKMTAPATSCIVGFRRGLARRIEENRSAFSRPSILRA